MSAGGAIGAVVGGVVGFLIAGPVGAFYGASIGFSVGMMIDPMTPDVGSVGQPLPDKLGITSNKIGIPVPDLLGTGSIRGNLLFYGGERSEPIYSETSSGGKGSGGSAPKQVTGYKYYMSWGIGLCIGEADEIYSIWQDDKVIWNGNLTRPASGGQETIVITDVGSVIVSFGTQDQMPITSVGNIIPDSTLNTPYRGLCWVYFKDCFIGNNNRMPSMRVVLRKTPELSFNSNNIINTYDYNPAHAIWYILNNLTGLPESWLNENDFIAMANTLNTDNRGMSILFGRQQKAMEYIESINAHIDNIVLYGNDGEFHPKLIRDDYSPATLPDVDESVLLEDPVFHRGSWIDTINEMKVTYTELLVGAAHYDLAGVGYNLYGQLGSSGNKDEFTEILANEGQYKLACGENFTMVVKADGTLWGTGSNGSGQLGLGDTTHRYVFTQVGTDTNWDKVFCGWNHTIAIKTDKTLWTTGHNGVGQLGVGDTTNRDEFVRIGIGDLVDKDWDKADGGNTHSLFLTTTGHSFCAGDADALPYETNQETIITFHFGGDWKDIACGDVYSLLIYTPDNTLWGIGSNNVGQLGLGSETVEWTTLTQVGGDEDWDSLSHCMYNSSLAIKTNGELWATGQNNYYQLGLNDDTTRYFFTQVGTASDWTKIKSFSYHSMAINNDGELWGTGANWYNNLGIAGEGVKHVFTQTDEPSDESTITWLDISCGYVFSVASRYILEAGSTYIAVDLRESTASPIAIDEGNITLQERVVTKSIKLASFTNNRNAVWASRQNLQKVNYPYAEIKCVVNRNLFRLDVGDCFYFSYDPYDIEDMIFRVVRVEEKDINSEEIVITAIEDVYGVTTVRVDYTVPEDNTQSATDYTIEPFDYEQIVESPYVLSENTTELIPMACRKSLLDLGFYLYMSIDDGASYSLLDAFPSLMPYGTLVGTYNEDVYTIDNSDTGLTIDFEFIEDLNQYETTTFSNVLAGLNNTALLGDEIVSVQTITPDVGNKYILTDVIRGRYGTEKETHTNGTEFYFLHSNILKAINNEIIPNVTRKFKLVPYNNVTTGDIAEASVIELSITGVSRTPYKPINFMANDGSYAARYTDDVVLTWSPRYRGVGAGIGTPGVVLASTVREGYFRIEVFVSDVKVREVTDIDAATWTYTEAMNTSDNGSLATSVTFKLYNFIDIDTIITYECDAVEVVCKKG